MSLSFHGGYIKRAVLYTTKQHPLLKNGTAIPGGKQNVYPENAQQFHHHHSLQLPCHTVNVNHVMRLSSGRASSGCIRSR